MAPLDLARFLVAFGVVPLLLVSGFVGLDFAPATALQDRQPDDPPWSFALTPGWSEEQLGFVVLSGLLLGVTAGRPAHGLAAVAIGILAGLAVDLMWLGGWVKPEDQSFVSLLPQAEWESRLASSALALVGAVSAGFLIGVVGRWLVRDRSRRPPLRPARAELFALGVAIIGGPLLAFGLASAAASSGLVVPDGAQVQIVRFEAGTITVDPAVLRAGQTRFRCTYAPDAEPGWAYFSPIPQGADAGTLPPVQDYLGSCGYGPGDVAWGTVADLRPGRYAWQQIDYSIEVPRLISWSPVIVVAP